MTIALLFGAATARAQTRRALHDGWRIQSSAKVGTDGARISSPSYHGGDWYAATVPSTVVGALVDAGVFKDPFFGMNLRSIPGMTYNIGLNFVHLPMDPSSPYAVPWWYRTTFKASAARGKHVTLQFDGINYRANIWLNGKRIADSTQVAGTYRRYEYDVTADLAKNGENALAVEITAPTPPDLQTTWVDWNPSPPDKDMGLWKPVYLATTGDVAVRYPVVISKVDTTRHSADVTIGTNLKNLADSAVSGELSATIGGMRVHQRFTVAARDSSYVELPAAHMTNPRLWWPAELGSPEMYDLDVAFAIGGATSDHQHLRTGIREVTSEMTPSGAALFRVNGRRILIRGGGWAPDMFFRPQPQRQDDQLRYALDMHLNTLRLEGNYEDDRFFERTDSLGLLVMTGWVCCEAFEEWPKWGAEQHMVAGLSLRDQIRRLRAHPSVFVWLNGSDNPPPADVEQMYLGIERSEHWPNPTVSSASAKPAQFSGASGVKMTGPYDWVPPGYWMQDATHGGGWGYNTETSPGAAVPPIESIRRMMPERDIKWPLDSVWLFHAAGGQFTHLLDRFNTALSTRFGAPTTAEEYTSTSQLMTYEGERAMFEAYRRNKYTSTGVIQWMFNNAWPSIYWHLFDWYLLPAGGYFGAKKANEPVHVLYSYDDRSIAVVNAERHAVKGVRLRARTLGIDGSVLSTRDTTLDLPADSSMKLFALAEPANVNGAYFADLRLTTAAGASLSTNFYWLSSKPDVLADTSTWYMTPVKAFADFTALKTMPAGSVKSSARFTRGATTSDARVTLTNSGKSLAFFVRLRVVGSDGQEALPVFWEDNYVTLLPGETRTITARWRNRDIHGAPKLVVTPWNKR
ncbi:MAG TPA: glycoside hydrolase family 2 protein [Gemmatimonadaceae bacterium]|nr:glycoside hydrolase family 2 protein [Gemmatimonadaceae bacterium]